MSVAARVKAKVGAARRCRAEFANWPAVLFQVGLSHLGWSRGIFSVQSRSGVTLLAPNHRTSWWPLVEVLADDTYRLEETLWEDTLGADVVLDIGAHVGSFTCALATYLPGARFVCVEPLPSAVKFLYANLVQNGLAKRAEILPAAIAPADGDAYMWATEEASCAASLTPGTGEQVRVRTLSFDSIVGTAGGRVEIVKLDCEGGEYAAILESTPWPWTTVDKLFSSITPPLAMISKSLLHV